MKSSKLLSIIVLLNCATQSFGTSGHGFNNLFSRAKNIILSLTAITIVADSNTASNDNTVSSNIFSRKKMIRDRHKNEKVEGYWASNQDPSKDYYHGIYPWPEANPQPWTGQIAFSAKLEKIENVLKKSRVTTGCKKSGIIGYRGMSISRFEPDKYVGSREFKYVDSETEEVIRWPEAFRPYYVDKFNVKPSEEFHEFVMNYPGKR